MARTSKIDFDPNELNYLHGYLDGMSGGVRSTAYIGSVLEFTHARMTPKLDLFIDMIAAANKENFHHVYEWGSSFSKAHDRETVGSPAHRLWSHTLKGHGRSKVASFDFRASVRPVPVNPILANNPSGPSVKEGVHIFYWKAMVMEYGMQMVVSPKLANYLAFVAGSGEGEKQTDARKTKGGIVFSKGPVTFTAGGGKTTGRFTNAFRFWWSQMAGEVFDREIAPRLEKDLAKGGVIGSYKSRTKRFSMVNNGGYSAGKAAAVKRLRDNQRNYKGGAEARSLFRGSGDE